MLSAAVGGPTGQFEVVEGLQRGALHLASLAS